jgi:hypothetical protein
MTFKITWAELLEWEANNWTGGLNNRDANDYRYGQKFINDHRNKGFIHTDPEVFYEENAVVAAEKIFNKYVSDEENAE